MSNQNRGALFFAGLVMGGLVGASLALLLAPQSGATTRGQIRAKSLELKDGAVEGLAEVGHRTQAQVDAISRSKDSLIQAVSQSKDRVVEAVG